jgi:hypothetical protein
MKISHFCSHAALLFVHLLPTTPKTYVFAVFAFAVRGHLNFHAAFLTNKGLALFRGWNACRGTHVRLRLRAWKEKLNCAHVQLAFQPNPQRFRRARCQRAFPPSLSFVWKPGA